MFKLFVLIFVHCSALTPHSYFILGTWLRCIQSITYLYLCFCFPRPDDVPWLYYANNADSVLGSSDIPTEYSLKKNSIDNVIRLFVSEHKMLVEY